MPHRQKPLLNHSPSEWLSGYKKRSGVAQSVFVFGYVFCDCTFAFEYRRAFKVQKDRKLRVSGFPIQPGFCAACGTCFSKYRNGCGGGQHIRGLFQKPEAVACGGRADQQFRARLCNVPTMRNASPKITQPQIGSFSAIKYASSPNSAA